MSVPRAEYPRPDLVRPEWVNLNGEWQFEIDHGNSGQAQKFFQRDSLNGKIIVPFVPESKLSGIEYTDFMQSVWYRRTFTLPSDWKGGRIILHFGAVDYLTTVWVNTKSAGAPHKGGYTPFSYDITDLLQDGENALVVHAFDDVRSTLQPTGKQSDRYENYSCYYTRCTGIWQTVWLEYVPELYIKNIRLTPDVDNERLYISAVLNRYAGGQELKAEAFLDGIPVASCTATATGKSVNAVLPIKNPQLWQPGKPILYDLTLTIGDDRITSYFGMRKIEINGYAIEINGTPVYQRLVLDQGYFPDGIYTATSDEDLKRDIELSMAVGFNGARMHMKVFEPRFIYWADKMGYLLWGEYPNWGLDESDERALLAMLPEWLEEIERDYNHPSIVGWCPFNETTTHRVKDIFKTVCAATKTIDPTRPVIDTSGYVHADNITDIYDVHDYEQDPQKFKMHYLPLITGEGAVRLNFPDHEEYNDQPFFVSEFGGAWWNIDGSAKGWGYGTAPQSIEEFYERYEGLVDTLLENPKMCAFCYTQLTDVMQEKNGIYAFDRKAKFDSKRLESINSKKAAIER